jgi:hypothetical protein
MYLEGLGFRSIGRLLNVSHYLFIFNYFIKGDTNAIAESINNKIQRFIMTNQGTRDREFFYFRLALLQRYNSLNIHN